MAKRKAQRPIDVQDMPWSHIGKDELDKAAERLWDDIRPLRFTEGMVQYPYHLASSADQGTVQRAVLALLGTTVPKMLRQRAKDYAEHDYVLIDLAEELGEEHGV